jgi:hypothetical protein
MALPASVREIAEVIGIERALYLVGQLPRCLMRDKRYPGAMAAHVILYVPEVMTPQHELVRILGWDDAVKLSRAFGGEILQPGSCQEVYRRWRDQAIREFSQRGFARKDIAEWFGISERMVSNIRAGFVACEIPQEARQAANDDHCPVINDQAAACKTQRRK